MGAQESVPAQHQKEIYATVFFERERPDPDNPLPYVIYAFRLDFTYEQASAGMSMLIDNIKKFGIKKDETTGNRVIQLRLDSNYTLNLYGPLVAVLERYEKEPLIDGVHFNILYNYDVPAAKLHRVKQFLLDDLPLYLHGKPAITVEVKERSL